jgi:hypothetical protein
MTNVNKSQKISVKEQDTYILLLRNNLYMASESKRSDSVPMSKLHDVVSENYTKLSDEFAKSQQQQVQAISGLHQEYLESIKVAIITTISVQKEYFSNPNNSGYQLPNTATTHMENVVNQSNKYTTDLIKWVNMQNQFIANSIELLKDYVKAYNRAIVMMAEYYSNIIKTRNSSLSKIQ